MLAFLFYYRKKLTMDRYDKLKSSPIDWYKKSYNLRVSAGIISFSKEQQFSDPIRSKLKLRKDFNLDTATWTIFPMMCGLSLELLYKSICIAKKAAFKENHNLTKLANSAGLEYSATQNALLKIYTESIIWHGKYPVPKENQKNLLTELANLKKEHLFDKVSLPSDLPIYAPNRNSSFEAFDEIWFIGSQEFAKYMDNE